MKKTKKIIPFCLIPFILSSCKNEEANQENNLNEIKQNESNNENLDTLESSNDIETPSNNDKENTKSSQEKKRVRIIKTVCFEVALNDYSRSTFFLNSNEDFVSLCNCYNDNNVGTKNESFESFLDEIKVVHFDEFPFIISPFKFSSSETDIRLTSLSYDESKYYVGFETKTPDVIDTDIRLCYFFSQIEKESSEKLMSKECEYVVHNLLGGEGSAYYH